MHRTRTLSRTVLASAGAFAVLAFVSFIFFAGDLSAQTIARGPYLQVGTPSSIIIRWRTDVSSSGQVRYGVDAASLASVANSAVTGTDHAVTLTGLAPDTRYYYSIGTTGAVLASGPTHKFVTAPPADASKPMRIWVIGDAGTGTSSQTTVRDAYATYKVARETDLWLVLGDNAYNSGTDAEYQARHFGIYPAMLRGSVSWYTLGNHDAGTGSVGAHPYHTMFSFPTAGEAGGVGSGTKSYYSFDYGNVHFISLDSQETNRAATGAMATWLTQDLQQNTKPWVFAFWHHPPYSKGSHDSDTELNMVEMRSNFLPILEQYGVDLVLAGHSHAYERSYLLDSHYGLSTTLQPAMIKNGGSGRPQETGAYGKPSVGTAPHEGAVYIVAGSSGQISGFPGAFHPAMFLSLNDLGSLVLDLNGDRLDAKFLRENATVVDSFTLVKGTISGNLPPDAAITSPPDGASYVGPAAINLSANATDEGSVTQVAYYLQWTDNAGNETGFKIERSSSGSPFAQIATVGANVSTYANTGLVKNRTYNYRVRATNATGDSAYSNTAAATTPRK